MKMKKSCLDCKLSYFTYFEYVEHIKDLICERGDYVVAEDEACNCDYYEQDLDPSEIISD